jgi:hypothetical protein
MRLAMYQAATTGWVQISDSLRFHGRTGKPLGQRKRVHDWMKTESGVRVLMRSPGLR